MPTRSFQVVIAETVSTPLEEQINGVDNLLYYDSQATSDGSMTLTATFRIGICRVLLAVHRVAGQPVAEHVRRLGLHRRLQPRNRELGPGGGPRAASGIVAVARGEHACQRHEQQDADRGGDPEQGETADLRGNALVLAHGGPIRARRGVGLHAFSIAVGAVRQHPPEVVLGRF